MVMLRPGTSTPANMIVFQRFARMTPTTGTLLFAHALVTNNNALKTLFGTILPANASAKESH